MKANLKQAAAASKIGNDVMLPNMVSGVYTK